MTEVVPPIPPQRSPEVILDSLDLPGPSCSPVEVLDHVCVDRLLVQDYRPLVDSLEWELASHYWDTQGLRPFIEETVPYAVNNSGWASENAAAVLLACCCQTKYLPDRIHVLELGAGLGMFARQLLDAFRLVCQKQRRDFYERLTYHVTDGSTKTVQQWGRIGLFADHGDHVRASVCEAQRPGAVWAVPGQGPTPTGLVAVFANYVLDTLPVAVIRRLDGVAQQLGVRTYLNRHDALEIEQQTGLTLDRIVALAKSDCRRDRAGLLPVLSYFQFEVAFRPDATRSLPYLQEALAFAGGTERMVINYGAIRCLESCLSLLHPTGFVLLSDYGPTRNSQVADLSYVQRFGSSVAASIHFPFLEHYFSNTGRLCIKPAGDDDRSIHSRLLLAQPAPHTTDVFLERYGDDRHIKADRMATTAIEHINAGRYDDALACYKSAIRDCPNDWQLLGQAAQFLTQQLHRYDQSRELGQAALAINPWTSAFLWNTLGNSLFCLGAHDSAHRAYQQAMAIDTDNPQSHLNLAYSFAQLGRYRKALVCIARGLASDQGDRFRTALLGKQQQIINVIATERAAQQQRLDQRHVVFTTAR